MPAMALSAAKAIRVFFIENFSKVKHRAPVRGLIEAIACKSSTRDPGQPPFGKLYVLHQTEVSAAMKSGKKLDLRCRQATRFGDYCIKTTINDVYTFDYRVTWVLSLKKS